MFSKYCSKIFTFFILFLSIHTVRSQHTTSFDFQHITEGISHSTATVFLEDSYGFIWIGTRNGLNRYDGKDFEIFNKTLDGVTGLTHEYVVSLYEDGENILISTNDGLSLYDRSLNLVIPYPFKKEGKEIESKRFQGVTKLHGYLWLGTEKSGLYRYQPETGAIKHLKLPNDYVKLKNKRIDRVLQIMPLTSDYMLVITTYNILVINKDMEIQSRHQQTDEIFAATTIDKNKYLLGTLYGSLVELQIDKNLKIHTKRKVVSPGYCIRSLTKSSNDQLWIGTENNGLYIYNKNLEQLQHIEHSVYKPNSISGNSIWALLNTRNGIMWVAPYRSGLNYHDPELFKFKHFTSDPLNPKSLSNKLVNCFNEDSKGNIWIGTDGGGLNYWNRSLNTFEDYSLKSENFGSDVVLSLLQTKPNELWVGTWTNGILNFDTKSKKYEELNTQNSFLKSNIVVNLLKDKNGRIWIVHYFAGVQVFNPKTDEHEDITLTSEVDGTEINSLNTIFEDNHGNVWIGTLNSGLFKLSENNGNWTSTHYHIKNSLSNNFVNSIIQDTENTIWVGTQGGLNKYIPEKDSFEIINKSNGLKNDAIKEIIDDKNKHLWLSTEEGIIRYHTGNEKTMEYGVVDGLQANQFNPNASLVTSKGEYIFGGVNGFNIFTAKDVIKRKDKLALFISDLKIFNKSVLPNDEFGVLEKDISQVDSLTLSHDQSVINIDFKALTMRHPESVDYAFYLEGFEKDWNYVGNNPSATYTNLNTGEYTLRMKSTNSDGVWVDNELKLHLTITPPYWQMWWFRLLLVVLILLLLYLAYYLKVRNFRKNQKVLVQKVAERTQELRLQKNKLEEAANSLKSKNKEIQQFTFAVSHDLKSPLNNIKGIAGLMSMSIETADFETVEEYLNLIDISCDNMSALISDITKIAELGKVENKNELLNTNDILSLSKDLIKGKLDKEKVELIIANNLPQIYGDHKRITQVFCNFLDNSIKYMGDQKNPTIAIDYIDNGDTNSFLVRDNGLGMNEHALQNLFTPFERFHKNTEGTGLGLYMVQKIAVSHGGTIIAESDGVGKGTTFKLTLPKAEIAVQKAKDNGQPPIKS
ncbi:two-component regulator propeller domain-containing protein [Zobellia sp. 1_MG-2023]|uniref:ligand-binding sensor domain-containing protein n=1 Tax=Zobellia sp. 1_MG-2023 TaxID=3062626 RepID=UPI0026E3AD41|nr:sensor histidine kinase [Zobellia sp. 1_MG-2023]MDO6821234.1 two-component regulator propeller domain-containing protein [Zobellia sp. 1_MG-2023]